MIHSCSSTSCWNLFCRPVDKDTAQQLETALAIAEGASEYLVQVTRTAAGNAAAEVQAGETLQDIMAGKLEMVPGSAVNTLTQAVEAAQQFPNLKVSLLHAQTQPTTYKVWVAMLTIACTPLLVSHVKHQGCISTRSSDLVSVCKLLSPSLLSNAPAVWQTPSCSLQRCLKHVPQS